MNLRLRHTSQAISRQQIGGLKDSRLDEVMVETVHTETHPGLPTLRVWDKEVNAAEETERRQLVKWEKLAEFRVSEAK